MPDNVQRFSFTGAVPASVLTEAGLVRRAAKRKTLYGIKNKGGAGRMPF
jgi:hypothetical protein